MNPDCRALRDAHAKAGLADRQARLSCPGYQFGAAPFFIGGTVCAAGRSLPDMSLAFALMAAIIGSTGSWATLSHGLYGTKPHRPRPGGTRDSHPPWVTAQGPSGTLSGKPVTVTALAPGCVCASRPADASFSRWLAGNRSASSGR